MNNITSWTVVSCFPSLERKLPTAAFAFSMLMYVLLVGPGNWVYWELDVKEKREKWVNGRM
jgi:hypothetical protein